MRNIKKIMRQAENKTNRFASRSDELEIMDDFSCSGKILDQTLHEIGVINKWLGGNMVTVDGVRKLLRRKEDNDRLSIADLGCGGGEMLALLARLGKKSGKVFSLTGIDANPNVIAYARANMKNVPEANFITQNILSEDFKHQQFDILIATLFFHHFRSDQITQFLKQQKTRVRLGFVINDIHRHWFAFHSIRLLTKFFSRSPMVRYDAPLSVLRAFSRQELIDIVEQAGIREYTIRWRWAFRWQVIVYC